MLGGYMFANKHKSDITFHGLMTGVNMWINQTVDVTDITCEGYSGWRDNDNAFIAWNAYNILVKVSIFDNSRQKELNESEFMEQPYTTLDIEEHDLSALMLPLCVPTTTTDGTTVPLILQFIRSANHTNITKGEPIVPKKVHVVQEAPAAEVLGTTGLIVVVILIALIVASDINYFERVIPICKKRFKSGLHRFTRRMHSHTAEGMQQMVSLTMGLGNMQGTNSRTRKTTVTSATSSHTQNRSRKLTLLSGRGDNFSGNEDLELGLIRRDAREEKKSHMNSAYD